jgi:PHD/YefM family antitoxin component YafN of YafNO toxin-antitoxin module
MENEKIKEELKTLEEEKKQDSKVLIDKEKFEQLMEKVNTLESALKGVTEVEDEKPKNLTALVRFIDGKVVIGYGNSYEKKSLRWQKVFNA